MDPSLRVARAVAEQAAAATRIENAVLATPAAIYGADGEQVTIPLVYPLVTPAAGDSVQVIRQGTSARILGSFTPPRHPGVTGRVTGVSGTTVTVTTDVGPLSAQIQGGYSPQVGDLAVCHWGPYPDTAGRWSGIVTGKVATAPTGSTGTSAGTSSDRGRVTPIVSRDTATIRTVEDDTWQSRWRGSGDSGDLIQGLYSYAPNHAWAFYGTGFAAVRGTRLQPGKAAQIFIPPRTGVYKGVRHARLVAHAAKRKPSSEPATLLTGVSLPINGDKAEWHNLPNWFINAFLSGAACGVGLVSDSTGDYMRIRGRSGARRHPDSLTIRIPWQR